MNRKDLKKYIAKKAYDIGFGAKKNFASFDILRKTNEYISLISTVIGILALIIDELNSKIIAASILILGVSGLYLIRFECRRDDYEKNGILFTKLYNELHKLFLSIEQIEPNNFSKVETKINKIEDEFYANSISDQVWLSDWLAHYKFFCQLQSEWISKELKLSILKDKIPLSFIIFILIIFVGTIIYFHPILVNIIFEQSN